jgi:hypothetical protein
MVLDRDAPPGVMASGLGPNLTCGATPTGACQIMCLVVGIRRFGGKVGGSMGKVNDVPVTAPIVQLQGESVPLAIVYLELALPWPLAIASVASTA